MNIILFNIIALCVILVANIVLFVLYIRAEKKLAKHKESEFFEEMVNKDDNTENNEY